MDILPQARSVYGEDFGITLMVGGWMEQTSHRISVNGIQSRDQASFSNPRQPGI